MKPQTLLLALAVLTTGIVSAQTTTSIPIFNPFFVDDQIACSPGCSYPGISGWICGASNSLFKASTIQYPEAPQEGLYVAAIGYSNATGSILQTLGDTVQANAIYVLKVSIGARADYPFTGYLASLMAGNVTLASSNKATPVGGTFVSDVIEYSSGPTPSQLGQPLQIFVKSFGTGQVNIASVSLTMTVK
jgi:hypothetical protein